MTSAASCPVPLPCRDSGGTLHRRVSLHRHLAHEHLVTSPSLQLECWIIAAWEVPLLALLDSIRPMRASEQQPSAEWTVVSGISTSSFLPFWKEVEALHVSLLLRSVPPGAMFPLDRRRPRVGVLLSGVRLHWFGGHLAQPASCICLLVLRDVCPPSEASLLIELSVDGLGAPFLLQAHVRGE